MQRYIERINTGLSPRDAYYEITVLAEDAPFTRSAPAWTLLTDREKICGGYLEVADGVCFAVQDGVIRTVLTRELSEESPPGQDPFPECGRERPDPHWPDRRYIANSDGDIECRTIFDGELVVVAARSRYAAWKELRLFFYQAGMRWRLNAGQGEYRERSGRGS